MERRKAIRRAPAADEPLSRMRLRAGRELAVVNVSSSGALVESAARLLPGTHVDVHILTSEGRTLVRSRVIRAYVCHLEPATIRYRGAIAFDRAVDAGVADFTVPEILSPAPPVASDSHLFAQQ